jgi:hypothetical protein
MKLFAVAAVVGLAAAQLEMLSQVPQCAVRLYPMQRQSSR